MGRRPASPNRRYAGAGTIRTEGGYWNNQPTRKAAATQYRVWGAQKRASVEKGFDVMAYPSTTHEHQSSKKLERVLASVPVPALPQSAIQLLELSTDPAHGPPEYARVIEADPGLASQVLKYVNSSYFGLTKQVANIRQAITLLGCRTVLNFVLWSAVYQSFPRPGTERFSMVAFWKDSVRRALAARWLAQQLCRSESDDVFIAALFEDLAVPLLAKYWIEEYRDALFPAPDGSCLRLSQRERRLWNWTHAEAGRLLVDRWQLPERLGQWIERHVDSEALVAGELDEPAACVALAALLPSVRDVQWPEYALWASAWQRWLGATDSMQQLFAEVDEQCDRLNQLLGVFAPGSRLTSMAAVVVSEEPLSGACTTPQ